MRSIRSYLNRSLLQAYILIWTLIALGLYQLISYFSDQELNGILNLQIDALAALVEFEKNGLEVERLGPLESRYSGKSEQVAFFEILDKSGKPILRSDSLRSGSHLLLDSGISNAAFRDIVLPNGKPGRLGAREVSIENGRGWSAVDVIVAINREDANERLTQLLLGLLGCSILFTSASCWITRHIVQTGFKPVYDISRHAASLRAENLNKEFPSKGMPEELSGIVEKLNEMLQRIRHAMQREKQLSIDIAHDLRTPVAEIQAIADAALNYPSSEEELRKTIGEAKAVSSEMAHLIERLLSLVRAESGELKVTKEPTDIIAIFNAVIQGNGEKATERSLTIEYNGLEEMVVSADSVLVLAIARNLIDNALDYAPEGSRIELTAERHSGQFSLSLSNLAPHLQDNDLTNLFIRHWRKDASRSHSTHTGIGLALALEYARIQSFNLSASLQADKKLAFHLSGKT